MSINFPTSLDTLTTGIGTTGQPLSNPNHITQHNNESLAIQALETKVGVDSSAVTSSLDYKIRNIPLSSLSDFNVSAPSNNQILSYNSTSSKWVNTGAIKFGGTGADGSLAISSGTTTIDCANAAVVIKNYTNISIVGTATLNFINPNANGTTVILKSQGSVALVSSQAPMLDMSGMGAAGGTAVSIGSGAGASAGNSGTDGHSFGIIPVTNKGVAGASTVGVSNGGAAASVGFSFTSDSILAGKYPKSFTGAGGASGGGNAGTSTTVTTGAGGRGGGALIIECAGALNFTTANGISVAGLAGSDGTHSGSNWMSNGGGGGGGGYCLILYNVLTSASGTITTSGGAASPNNANYGGSGTGGRPGGGGASYQAGSASSDSSSLQTSGGAGATGYSLIAQNTEFA